MNASNPEDMHARMEAARALADEGKLDEATKEYVWLWEHMLEHEPSMYGVRLSFLVGELAEMVARHPGARAAVKKLRDRLVPSVSDLDVLTDWLSLNDVLSDGAASLAWYDQVRATLPEDRRLVAVLEIEIVPRLVEAGRWKDVARFYPEPLAALASQVRRSAELADLPSEATPEMVAEIAAVGAFQLRETAVRLIRALRASGRDGEAGVVAKEARRLDASSAMDAAIGAAERA